MTFFIHSLIVIKKFNSLDIFSSKFYNGKKPKSQEEILKIVNADIKVEEKHSQTMYFTWLLYSFIFNYLTLFKCIRSNLENTFNNVNKTIQ
jgi:hypothetical protein